MNKNAGAQHSFIVRIWWEAREIKDSPPEWRGVIEHVSTGNRRYFRNLEELSSFIGAYLDPVPGKKENPEPE